MIVAKFLNGTLCIKPERVPWLRLMRERVLTNDAHCIAITVIVMPLDKTGRAICTIFTISGGTTGKLCCGHFRVGEAFALSLLQAQACNDHYT